MWKTYIILKGLNLVFMHILTKLSADSGSLILTMQYNKYTIYMLCWFAFKNLGLKLLLHHISSNYGLTVTPILWAQTRVH